MQNRWMLGINRREKWNMKSFEEKKERLLCDVLTGLFFLTVAKRVEGFGGTFVHFM